MDAYKNAEALKTSTDHASHAAMDHAVWASEVADAMRKFNRILQKSSTDHASQAVDTYKNAEALKISTDHVSHAAMDHASEVADAMLMSCASKTSTDHVSQVADASQTAKDLSQQLTPSLKKVQLYVLSSSPKKVRLCAKPPEWLF